MKKKCMIAIDHPFIVNFVKTMKNKKWVFILEEYILLTHEAYQKTSFL